MIWLTWRQFRASAAMAAAALAAVLAVSGPGLADDYSSPTSSPAGKKVRPRRDDIASRLPQPVSGHQSAPEKRTMIHTQDRLETPQSPATHSSSLQRAALALAAPTARRSATARSFQLGSTEGRARVCGQRQGSA
jgi:hypothetical protein